MRKLFLIGFLASSLGACKKENNTNSQNTSINWTQTAFTEPSVNSILINGTSVFVACGSLPASSIYGAGFYSSNDYGASSVATSSGMPVNPAIYSIFSMGSTILAGLCSQGGSQGGGIYLSKNKGSTWKALDSLFLQSSNVSSFVSAGSGIFANISGSVYQSADTGNTWKIDSIVSLLPTTSRVEPNFAIASQA